jgi:hypothetical protein
MKISRAIDIATWIERKAKREKVYRALVKANRTRRVGTSLSLSWLLVAALAACHGEIDTSSGDGGPSADARVDGDGDVIADAVYYAITANGNGMLVSAQTSASVLAADRTVAGDGESFELVDNGDGTLALRAKLNGRFASVDVAAGGRLAATAPAVGASERFTRVPQPDGSFALQAAANGKFVTTDVASGAALSASRDAVGGAAETYRFGALVGSSTDDPDLGDSVLVFDPSMSAQEIQARLDDVFGLQERNEFGPERRALLFKPGRYDVDVNVGYYTQVLGLGVTPDEVVIHGDVHAEADFNGGNATQTFWRSVEGLAVEPLSGTARWAVSQASPFRRMHILGSLALDDNGWASGGFVSDSVIDDNIDSGTQQQWFTRDSEWGSWSGANWNMVFAGVINAPDDAGWPDPPYTTIDTVPMVREKPYLFVDAAGHYAVFVPALRQDSRGTTWHGRVPRGRVVPIADFYVAREGVDSASTINAALAEGKHVLFTPGIFHLDATLRVERANTILLGIGLATLEADDGVVAMKLADVDGVEVAGLLFDAGETSSPTLLEVGAPGASARHAANPISLHDVFFRVGGAALGKAEVSLAIHANDVIGDHFWIWRGDHSYGTGWDENVAANGLIVNGDDVTIYGLFVEHYQGYQTTWNGDGGRVYFYQSEIPYDVPSQGEWRNGQDGFASYKIGDDVTTHEAYGLGIYCYFSANPSVRLGSAIEAPATGVSIHHAMTVSLGGHGEITHIVNGTGEVANGGHGEGHLPAFP